MTAEPVTIAHSTAKVLLAAIRQGYDETLAGGHVDADELTTAIAELEVVTTSAAASAAWEPFLGSIADLRDRDRHLSDVATANVRTLLEEVRRQFASAGISIDDPAVIRHALMTISVATAYAADIHLAGAFTCDQLDAVKQSGHPIALALSRLVPAEVRP